MNFSFVKQKKLYFAATACFISNYSACIREYFILAVSRSFLIAFQTLSSHKLYFTIPLRIKLCHRSYQQHHKSHHLSFRTKVTDRSFLQAKKSIFTVLLIVTWLLLAHKKALQQFTRTMSFLSSAFMMIVRIFPILFSMIVLCFAILPGRPSIILSPT